MKVVAKSVVQAETKYTTFDTLQRIGSGTSRISLSRILYCSVELVTALVTLMNSEI